MFAPLLLVGVFAYAIGSVPIHRFLGLPDFDSPEKRCSFVRNTSRFLLNVSKGLLAVMIAGDLGSSEALIAAIFVTYGHNYPFWPGFRGGVGMGVLLGAMLALNPTLGLCALFAWLLAFYVVQRTAIAGLTAAIAAPLAAHILALPFNPLALCPMTALVLWRHRRVWEQIFDFGPKETEDAFRGL